MKLVGMQKVDFKDKDGKLVNGTSLYVTYSKDYVDGIAVEKIWANSNAVIDSNVRLNTNIDVLYNKYGKVTAVMAGK